MSTSDRPSDEELDRLGATPLILAAQALVASFNRGGLVVQGPISMAESEMMTDATVLAWKHLSLDGKKFELHGVVAEMYHNVASWFNARVLRDAFVAKDLERLRRAREGRAVERRIGGLLDACEIGDSGLCEITQGTRDEIRRACNRFLRGEIALNQAVYEGWMEALASMREQEKWAAGESPGPSGLGTPLPRKCDVAPIEMRWRNLLHHPAIEHSVAPLVACDDV